jgi:ssDNA-binding Zn-finger/Zn-ribbon topoisomerase 1
MNLCKNCNVNQWRYFTNEDTKIKTAVCKNCGNEFSFAYKDIPVQTAEVGKRCKVCKQGVILERQGPYGTFFGCSRFPKCRLTFKPAKALNLSGKYHKRRANYIQFASSAN